MTEKILPVLAILGGTGDLGTGLARRWAQAGYRVIIGSRTQQKAEAAATSTVAAGQGVQALPQCGLTRGTGALPIRVQQAV